MHGVESFHELSFSLMSAPFAVIILTMILSMVVSILISNQAQAGIEVHGHRGARARFPENTLPAFEYAIRAGVDYLEMDMAVTKDRVIVISHDPFINPQICQRMNGEKLKDPVLIHSLKLSEVKKFDCGAIRNPRFSEQTPVPHTAIPTLDEVFDMAKKSKVRFNIETKIFKDHPDYTVDPETFVRIFLAVVRKHAMTSRVILQSFDYRTLEVAKRLDPSIPRVALAEEGFPPTREILDTVKPDVFSPDHEMLKTSDVELAHANHTSVVPWTVNSEADWEKLIQMKVDGIISDDPERLISFLKAKGLHK